MWRYILIAKKKETLAWPNVTSNVQKTTLRYSVSLQKKTWCGHPKHPKQTNKNLQVVIQRSPNVIHPMVFPPSTTSSQALTASMRVRSATESRVSPRAVSMERLREGRMYPKKIPDIRYIHMFKGWKFLLRGVFWCIIWWTKKPRNTQMLVWQKKNKQHQLQTCPETFVSQFVENPAGHQLLQTP